MFISKFVIKLQAGSFFFPMQISCEEAEICNLNEHLHTKIFLIVFNRKSGAVHHLRYVHVVLQCVLYLKNAWMDLNATCTKLVIVNSEFNCRDSVPVDARSTDTATSIRGM